MDNFYAEDLAAIHAEAFGGMGAAAAEVVAGQLGDKLAGAVILDIGCGAGAMAAPLLARGARVWGLDLSPALLALARKRAPGATLTLGSLHDTPLPPADAVCAIGEVVNYLADPRAGPEGLERFLARSAQALPAGGLLLFDVASPGRGPGRSFTETPDWAVGAISLEADGVLERRITTFRRSDGAWRRSDEIHRLALLDVQRVCSALEAAGFDFETAAGYADAPALPGLTVFRAHRR